MADNNSCPFCNIEPDRVLYEDAYCFTVRDGYPVAKGHSLIIPKRHIVSFFETTKQENDALLRRASLGSGQPMKGNTQGTQQDLPVWR
jgi:diadenosine tetraphosphate (Ap4A) HIT family hydrolase